MSANGILYLVLYQRDDMRSTGVKEKPLRQKLERLLRLIQKLAIVIWREHLIRYIPNKKAGQSIKLDTSTAIDNISHSVESVNRKLSLSEDLAHRLCGRKLEGLLRLIQKLAILLLASIWLLIVKVTSHTTKKPKTDQTIIRPAHIQHHSYRVRYISIFKRM